MDNVSATTRVTVTVRERKLKYTTWVLLEGATDPIRGGTFNYPQEAVAYLNRHYPDNYYCDPADFDDLVRGTK